MFFILVIEESQHPISISLIIKFIIIVFGNSIFINPFNESSLFFPMGAKFPLNHTAHPGHCQKLKKKEIAVNFYTKVFQEEKVFKFFVNLYYSEEIKIFFILGT